ncbi:hypothetical protein SAMN04487904_101237 [Actinopolyspora lacussalsi subsp. righensis]|uniref:Uncharacterized protein n=2 Tax=Actinopolyspora righensis TaxID=995060 RepID=A0A1I6X684_9ACTN|nr:hypothetical protein SAMN04487904_101237 [Actinopolyspora righensis]
MVAESDAFVLDSGEYQNLCSRVAVTFDLSARLPGQVFKKDGGDSLFCEFDSVLAPELWPALCELARWHGDSCVDLLVLEPSCEAFYFPEYRMYPALSLSVDADEDDYWTAVGYEPNGEILGSIAKSAEIIAVSGRSGKWGCWGERSDEVAVFQGFPDSRARNEWWTRYGPFMEVADALQTYVYPAPARRTVSKEYATKLTANYCPSWV